MNDRYQEAVDYLYSFVNFEHRQIETYAPENISLDRPRRLLSYLGNPHLSFNSIHIAGTKGKGSVAAMCATCLREAGLTVALYTSPHLQDFRDRIRVLRPGDGDGRIPPERVADLVDELKPAIDRVPDLTWYELVTALGFLHFAYEKVDFAVVEVGLGGRLDATNLLQPLVSVITSLSFDHTYLLGNTLSEIAAEKGGIIKPGVPVITSPQEPEAMQQLVKIAESRGAPMTIIGRDWDWRPGPSTKLGQNHGKGWEQEIVITKTPPKAFIPLSTRFSLALAGRHQQENALVAIAALNAIQPDYPAVDVESVRGGMENVNWPGRLQVLPHDEGRPIVLLDCAHNVDSAEKLAYTLIEDCVYEELWLVLGATVDKDVKGILRVLLPLSDNVILTASSHPRACSPAELFQMATDLGYEVMLSTNVTDAFKSAWRRAGPDDLICIAGSIFVVGDLLNQWEGLQFGLPAESRYLSAKHL
jgi:dihydrofolate synthase/folylpolyglutamate synthase